MDQVVKVSVIMLTYNREAFIPVADILSGIVKSISKISETAFFHVGITIIKLSGLVSGR